jgi:hypothetical protein
MLLLEKMMNEDVELVQVEKSEYEQFQNDSKELKIVRNAIAILVSQVLVEEK